MFVLFKLLFFLPLVYPKCISGQNGVSGQPASLGLVLCCPLGAIFYRPIRETPFPLLAKESFEVNILLSLAAHERLTDLAVVPREKPHTGAAAREQPRDSPVIER